MSPKLEVKTHWDQHYVPDLSSGEFSAPDTGEFLGILTAFASAPKEGDFTFRGVIFDRTMNFRKFVYYNDSPRYSFDAGPAKVVNLPVDEIPSEVLAAFDREPDRISHNPWS